MQSYASCWPAILAVRCLTLKSTRLHSTTILALQYTALTSHPSRSWQCPELHRVALQCIPGSTMRRLGLRRGALDSWRYAAGLCRGTLCFAIPALHETAIRAIHYFSPLCQALLAMPCIGLVYHATLYLPGCAVPGCGLRPTSLDYWRCSGIRRDTLRRFAFLALRWCGLQSFPAHCIPGTSPHRPPQIIEEVGHADERGILPFECLDGHPDIVEQSRPQLVVAQHLGDRHVTPTDLR